MESPIESDTPSKLNTLSIDFGTTNSSASYWKQDHIETVKFINNEDLIKSIVAYSPKGDILFGKGATALARPSFRVRNVKRILGMDLDECKQFDEAMFGEKLEISDENNVYFFHQTGSKKMSRTVSQVITSLLEHIKAEAEKQAGHEFIYAAISVPTTFRTKQKRTFKKAVQDAGFKILLMLSEPTSAGLYYQVNNNVVDNEIVLVFDFGGGTLDLSLMRCNNNVYDVLCSGGLHNLGGNDVDAALLTLIEGLYREAKNEELYSGNSKGAIRKKNVLLQIIEDMKIELQQPEHYTKEIEFEDNNGDPCSFTIPREQANRVIISVINRIDCCLEDMGNQIRQKYNGKRLGSYRIMDDDDAITCLCNAVAKVILVGGSSKLCVVYDKLHDLFGDKVCIAEDTQLCVCKGLMEAVCLMDNPSKSIREVLYHTLLIKQNGKEIGRINRGVSIPFQTQYGLRPDRRTKSMVISICEIDEEREEHEDEDEDEDENEVVLVEEEILVDHSGNDIYPYIALNINVNTDGLITVFARDEMNGYETTIGTVDV